MCLNPLIDLNFFTNAHLLGFLPQLRSALNLSNDDGSFLPRFLPTNPLNLPLAAFTEKIEAYAVILLRVDQVVEPISQPDKVQTIKLALKDAILHPLTKVLQGFENLGATSVILDII
jgi:hypothetical protein